ncbi:hypothetical protein [Symbiopectobacterium purcellii]|uniref:hypothetical protein n=1 Tax=Symbiopectobacterium purcellii TaxID=2871826 RepID=UPI003F8349ED
MITAGGFGANFDMIKHYDPKLVGFKTTNAPCSLGEGVKMAESIIAKRLNFDYII